MSDDGDDPQRCKAVPIEELEQLADEWEQRSQEYREQNNALSAMWGDKHVEELREVISEYE